jgi:hypothetical protein
MGNRLRGVLSMSDEGVKQSAGVRYWQTPTPKHVKGSTCPANKQGNSCPGATCRYGPKGCIYRRLRADYIAGRQAVITLRKEGFIL